MSNLKRVTITGADDSTDILELAALSAEFPFVEWGILVSMKHEGSPRFPSRSWIDYLSHSASTLKMNISTHVCGKWVRELLVGMLKWPDLPSCVDVSDRVQINTHAQEHISTIKMIHSLKMLSTRKQFIFQWDGVNDHLGLSAHVCGVDTGLLFDKSGGAGILPRIWPCPIANIPCGYAGGLGPDNVIEQIARIEQVCALDFWIDMERNVRTANDLALDLTKVRAVLTATKPLILGA